MRTFIKAAVGGWIGFKVCESVLGPLTRKIWRALEATTERFARQMGWSVA